MVSSHYPPHRHSARREGDTAIDTSFDFRTEVLPGQDPDSHSPTLRRYHQLLWSRPLPNGALFGLDTSTPGAYLHHRSALGEFWLSSDTTMPTYTHYESLKRITGQLSRWENRAFDTRVYTIGGMLIFPSQKIDGQITINGAKGFHPSVRDRMDLTLECIRRHYAQEASPLGSVLARYSDFFALFEDFQGYVEYFMLQDLLTDDAQSVKFFMQFQDFKSPALPADVRAYREFRRNSMDFVATRNERIDHRWKAREARRLGSALAA